MTVSAFILMMLLVTTSIAGYTVPEADFLVQADTDADGDAATIITVSSPFSGKTTVKVSAVMESGSRRLKLNFPTTPNRLCPGVPLTHFISELRNVTVENTTIAMEPALINGKVTSFPSEICAWRIQKGYRDSANIKGMGVYDKWQDSQKCINKANEDMTCVEQLREVPWLFQCLGGKCPEGYTGPALMMLKVPIPIACFCQLLPK